MNVLVVGGGGREHAIIRKLRENKTVEKLYALPGNAGMSAESECVDIAATDIEGIVSFAVSHDIGFAVVAPDDPLVLGCADALRQAGISTFGPSARAAMIKGSKVFAKELMKKYGIPTAAYEVFDDLEKALAYVESAPLPTVIKADGLALGKGVVIARTREEARNALREMMERHKFGKSGDQVVIEEFLEGPEVSVLSFTDGETLVPMVSSMDHKRALDNDEGLNTGGMGTVAPNPYYTDAVARGCMERIFLPTIRAMKAEGRPFAGCLYFGLMLSKDGPRVIEYNCRFGDPETQVVLPLMESDLLSVMRAVAEGTLDKTEVRFSRKHACCVIMASRGYPAAYEKGFPLTIGEDVRERVYVAGAKWKDGVLVTNGGRVLGCTAVADTLEDAIRDAYAITGQIHFENAFFRHDIGQRALKAKEI